MSPGLLSSPDWNSFTLGLWWGERLVVGGKGVGFLMGGLGSCCPIGSVWWLLGAAPSQAPKACQKRGGANTENSSYRLHDWSSPGCLRNPGDRGLKGHFALLILQLRNQGAGRELTCTSMRPQSQEAAALCPSGGSDSFGRASCLVCVWRGGRGGRAWGSGKLLVLREPCAGV